MKFGECRLLLLGSESCSLLFLIDKIIFSLLYKRFIDIIVFSHFGHGGYISSKYLILQSHVVNNITNRANDIPISNNTNDLYKHDNDDLRDRDRSYVAITHSKHGGEGEVE